MQTYTEGSTIFMLSIAVGENDVFFKISNTAWSLWFIVIALVVWTIYLFS